MIKKIILSLAATLVYACLVNAQVFYARVGLGYALPMAGQTMDGTATPYSGSLNNTTSGTTNMVTYDIGKASFGAGLQSYLALGYMFNQNVGLDVAFNFMPGARKYTFHDFNVSVNGIATDVTITQQAQFPVLLTPALVFKTSGSKTKLYTRTGLVLPLSTRIDQHQIFVNRPGTGARQEDDYYWVVKNKFSLGFSGAIGLETRFKRGKVFGEVSFVSLAAYAKEANLVDVAVDGQGGYLRAVPEQYRKVTYSSSFTTTSTDYYHQPTYSQPFSNCSVNVGISFPLGGREQKKPASKYKRK